MEEEKEPKETNSSNVEEPKKTEKEEKKIDEETDNFTNNKPKSLKWIFAFAIAVIILSILSTGFALVNLGNENIIAGVMVNKLNLQGLNKEEAKKVINKKIEEKLSEEIKIKIDTEDYNMLLSQIELKYDVDNAIEKAHNVGRNGNIFVNNFNILKSKIVGINIEMDTDYNEEVLNKIINEFKEKIPNCVKQATYCVEEDKLIITKGQEGASFDTEELSKKIIRNFDLSVKEEISIKTYNTQPDAIDIEKIYNEVHTEAKDAYYTTDPFQVFPEVIGIDFDKENAKEILKEDKEEYEISLKITKPNKTIKEIGTQAFPDLLGTFSTRYDASNTSRTTNLKLAVSKLNGVVVMPGEICSYNKTLGKRTAEAGYKDAAGYQGGKVVPMLGGGICQISSTLYDAIVYANLEVVERHNHGFLTSYVGAGKDATVVYGSLDFKFKNTRKYPITIKASAQNGIARIDIYGIKEETEYQVEISSTILNYITYKTVYENDSNLPQGTEKVTQNGMNGCKSITYKILKLNGVEVSRKVLSTDTYNAMNKYITRGTKTKAPIVTPVQPKEPVTPAESEEPVTPIEPQEPEEPVKPEEPTVPEEPSIPEEPIEEVA